MLPYAARLFLTAFDSTNYVVQPVLTLGADLRGLLTRTEVDAPDDMLNVSKTAPAVKL